MSFWIIFFVFFSGACLSCLVCFVSGSVVLDPKGKKKRTKKIENVFLFFKCFLNNYFAQTPRFARDPYPPVFWKVF